MHVAVSHEVWDIQGSLGQGASWLTNNTCSAADRGMSNQAEAAWTPSPPSPLSDKPRARFDICNSEYIQPDQATPNNSRWDLSKKGHTPSVQAGNESVNIKF